MLLFVHQLIITLNLFSENIFSQTTSFLMLKKIIGLDFMEIKQFSEIIKSDEQRCIKFVTVLNQSDLIILFAEVFVRFFCHHLYLVSLDFLFLPEQTAKSISKRERFFDAFVPILKVFF